MPLNSWRTIDTGSSSAIENMAIDAALLENLSREEQQPILHLYEWNNPSATYGHFIDPAKLLQEEALREGRLHLARRPTGGGIIFHLADVAFSALVPSTHPGYSDNIMENYAFINRMVMKAIALFTNGRAETTLMPSEPSPIHPHERHFCMAKPTKYDVMVNGRKVGGGAQRRTKHGFLHQGSISLAFPDEAFLKHALLPGTSILEAMRAHTYALLEGSPTPELIAETQKTMRTLLANIITQQ